MGNWKNDGPALVTGMVNSRIFLVAYQIVLYPNETFRDLNGGTAEVAVGRAASFFLEGLEEMCVSMTVTMEPWLKTGRDVAKRLCSYLARFSVREKTAPCIEDMKM
jgi:hypothetical protein